MLKYILHIILIAFTLTLAQSKNQANKLRLAKQFESLGQLDKAEQIYRDVHKSDSINYIVYNSLLKILLQQKKYSEAEGLVKSQLRIAKSKVALYGDLGSIYFKQDNSKKALEIWNRALELEPQNPFAYRTIANYLIDNRLIDDAIDVLNLGNEVSDDHTIFSYDIANYYSITMKFEEATREYCKILEKKPTQYNLIRSKIFGYLNSNQATEITKETVADIYNENEQEIILKLLCDIYVKLNDYLNAQKFINKYEELTTNNGTNIYTFAQQAVRYKNYKLASQLFKIIIDEYPQSALYSESEISFVRALQSDVESQLPQKNSWKTLIIDKDVRFEDYKELLNAYKKLSQKYSNTKIGSESEYRQAVIYQKVFNNLEISDSIFNKILDERQNLQYIAGSHFGLGKNYIKKDSLEKAIFHFNQVIFSRTADSDLKLQAKYYLAKIDMWNAKFTSAIKKFNEITENPKNQLVNNSLNYLMILNTFKSDSLNLISFVNADYLLDKEKYEESLLEFKKIAQNKNLFLLKDFAALKYVELLLALNYYQEAVIFLEEISNRDVDNIFKDRFLFLLGSVYNYELKNKTKAMEIFNRFFTEFSNSIYYSKVQKIISEYN